MRTAVLGHLASGVTREAVLVWRAIRPLDWIKNLFVFAPLFFSGEATDLHQLRLSSLVFLAFCAMSSAVYLLNDIHDRERDRRHPIKRHRPVASGALPLGLARATAIGLAGLSAAVASAVSLPVLAVVLGYAALNALYTAWLKHIVILDVFAIAIGFVLRLFAGGAAIQVEPTSWLVITTFLLALVLGLGKRRQELIQADADPPTHRPVLEQYSIGLVDALMAVVLPVTLITYLFYTLDAATIARFQSRTLYLTGVFVVFGLFRYLYLVHRRDLGGSPAELVVTDGPLRSAVLAWIVAFALIVYLS